VNANVLANGNKDNQTNSIERVVKISTFLWGMLWFSEILMSETINGYVSYFYTDITVRYLGLLIELFGIIVFIWAMIDMKTSWRVGIDKGTITNLITSGVYRMSRNPAFIGFYLMFIGLFISYPNVLTLINVILNIGAMHLLILQEEKHLLDIFSERYIEYTNNTPRYFLKDYKKYNKDL
jgi:protein-S-isoprenylcysteine O-methyltransferase Ste14